MLLYCLFRIWDDSGSACNKWCESWWIKSAFDWSEKPSERVRLATDKTRNLYGNLLFLQEHYLCFILNGLKWEDCSQKLYQCIVRALDHTYCCRQIRISCHFPRVYDMLMNVRILVLTFITQKGKSQSFYVLDQITTMYLSVIPKPVAFFFKIKSCVSAVFQ